MYSTLLQVSGVQIAGGLLLLAVLSTLLANTAAYYVTGEIELPRAAVPGVAMALAGIASSVLPILVTVLLALVVDSLAVKVAYGLDNRRTAMVTTMHFTLIVVVAYVVNSALAIYQSAPA
ncbi:hypothetical protein [Halobaculum sp. MBLA0143]|uniref:DUF7473 family protein n=1 Tax=Halobaculum sp. MBLA0143 TaxID=3079933 RepID=UPI00352551D9